MKTTTLLSTLALVMIPVVSNAQQHVWRVNNTPGNPYDADYVDLPTAISLVPTGDTLHIEASTYSYGSINLTRHLVLIGPGYFLDVNMGLQASAIDARIDNLTFAAGSDTSTVMGLYVIGGSGVSIQTSNINFIRNRLNYGISIPNGTPRSNLYIQGNHIAGGISSGSTVQVSNLTISNNIMGSGFGGYPNTTTGVFTYNVTGQGSGFYGMTCANNIFRSGTTSVNDNVFHHNYFHNLHPVVPGTANVLASMGTVFATAPGPNDNLYGLAMFTPAQTASDVSGPIGVFGGNTPYHLSGIPKIPTIYQLSAPGTAIQGQTIQVTLSTKSNN